MDQGFIEKLEFCQTYHNIVLQVNGFELLEDKLDDFDEYSKYKGLDGTIYEAQNLGAGFVKITGIYPAESEN